MNITAVLQELDSEIARLQTARSALASLDGGQSKPRLGRPPKNLQPSPGAPRKRTISAEGRKRIAEAMKKRWAARLGKPASKAATKSAKKSQTPSLQEKS